LDFKYPLSSLAKPPWFNRQETKDALVPQQAGKKRKEISRKGAKERQRIGRLNFSLVLRVLSVFRRLVVVTSEARKGSRKLL
jgi:hypothetical protein